MYFPIDSFSLGISNSFFSFFNISFAFKAFALLFRNIFRVLATVLGTQCCWLVLPAGWSKERKWIEKKGFLSSSIFVQLELPFMAVLFNEWVFSYDLYVVQLCNWGSPHGRPGERETDREREKERDRERERGKNNFSHSLEAQRSPLFQFSVDKDSLFLRFCCPFVLFSDLP